MSKNEIEIRLEIIEKEIKFYVHDNFGYSPSDNKYFDSLIDERDVLTETLRSVR